MPPRSMLALLAVLAAFALGVAPAADVYVDGQGNCASSRVPPGLHDARTIGAAGLYGFFWATTGDGSLVPWADQWPVTLDIPHVARASLSGYWTGIVLLDDGSVRSWYYPGVSNTPAGLTDAVDVAMGSYDTYFAVRRDGTAVGWSEGSSSLLPIPAGLSGVQSLSVGWDQAAALRSDGSLVVWGPRTAQPPLTSGIKQVSEGNYRGLAVTTDGHVIGWPDAVPALDGIVAVSAGGWLNLALRADGTVVQWGYPGYQLPPLPPLSDVVAIAAGYQSAAALRADGSVVAWGANTQRGMVEVPAGLGTPVSVSRCGQHVLAAFSDGTVSAWGDDSFHQCEVPAGLDHVIGVSAGQWHSLAWKDDGTVVGWGSGLAATPPGDLANVVKVASGDYHALALSADGHLTSWGTNFSGELNLPSDGHWSDISARGDMSAASSGTWVEYVGGSFSTPHTSPYPLLSMAVTGAYLVGIDNDTTRFYDNCPMVASWAFFMNWPLGATLSGSSSALYALTPQGDAYNVAGPTVGPTYRHLSAIDADSSGIVAITTRHAPRNLRLDVDAPTVPEDAAIGTVVAHVLVDDGDADGTITYSGQCPGSVFIVDAATGEIRVNAALDHERRSQYPLAVSATDEDGMTIGALTWVVTVTDVNEPPTDIALSATILAAAPPAGTTVGTFSAVDPDHGDSHVFALVDGDGATDNASFSIIGSVLKTAVAGLTSPLSIRVRATDSGALSTEKVFALTIAPSTTGGSSTGGSSGGVTTGGVMGDGGSTSSGGGCGLGGGSAALVLALSALLARPRRR